MWDGNWHRPVLVALVLLGGCAQPVEREYRWQALGGELSARVWASSERVAQQIADEMAAATRRAEAVVDLARADSELSRLNAGAGSAPFRVGERDLYVCIKRALEYARVSNGDFDPTLGPLTALYRHAAATGQPPTDAAVEAALEHVGWERVVLMREAHAVSFRDEALEIDLSVMADGLALDLAVRAFSRVGSRAGLLSLRGSLQAWGAPPGEDSWEVPLPDFRHPDAVLGTVRVDNRAIGLSGPDRGVLDPRTGRPAESNVLLAVAIAEGAADASALAQALYVGGSVRAGTLLSKTYRVEAILVLEGDGQPYVLASASLRERLRLSDALELEVGGRIRFILPPQSIAMPL